MREQLLVQQNTASAVRGAPTPAVWATLDSIYAEHIPLTGTERLDAGKLGSQVTVRFRVYARADITAAMRVLWTPSWLSSVTRRIVQISAIVADPRDTNFMFLECGVDDAAGTA